jgi:CBS domain-containing protein
MRDGDIGNVIVTDGGRVAGIVTDRDIVVRAIADGREPQSTTVGDVCSSGPRTLEAGDSVEAAAQAMGESSIRRLPVVKDGELVGVLSLGDLAQDRDAGQPLADISAASPNH